MLQARAWQTLVTFNNPETFIYVAYSGFAYTVHWNVDRAERHEGQRCPAWINEAAMGLAYLDR